MASSPETLTPAHATPAAGHHPRDATPPEPVRVGEDFLRADSLGEGGSA
ncbi:hypothetical protein [Streptomyces phaeofaciens]|nr:hypothetical protein [Streptomyces phaeofaciens]